MGKYMYNNQVLNAQTKDDADQAMAESWRNYVDAWFEMQRKYEQQFIAQQEEAPQEGLQINDNIELL
jgi:head-tail adaptor